MGNRQRWGSDIAKYGISFEETMIFERNILKMNRDNHDWVLVITSVLLIVANLVGWVISLGYSNEFNEYKAICDNYVEDNITEDALNNLIVELEMAPKELMLGVRRFILNPNYSCFNK